MTVVVHLLPANAERGPLRKPLEAEFARFSDAARASWEDCFLAGLPDDVVLALLAEAEEFEFSSGTVFHHGSRTSESGTLALVVDGLLRVYVQSGDGREATIRYAAEGSIVGLPAALLHPEGGDPASAPPFAMAGGAALAGEAARPSRILRWPVVTFRQLAREHSETAWRLCRYLAQEMTSIQRILAEGIFKPVKVRVASHLLDLAVPHGGLWIAPVSHQDIANAVGSVRESVSRALREMQLAGLIERREGDLVLVDRAGLHALSKAA